jgi:hypothetical protein
MTTEQLIERLNALPKDAEIDVKTDGLVGPLEAFDIKAVYESLEHETPVVEILLKRAA